MALPVNRNFRLPEDEYNHGPDKKTGICVHHTVGGTAESTYHWWKRKATNVGTAYIIDRDGVPLEVFDPKNWAWQFGLNWPDPGRRNFERRFIGIELASEGGIINNDGKFYCFNRITPRTEKLADEVFDAGRNYRAYRYYDRYETAQIDTLTELINHLCEQFDIPRRMLPEPMEYYGKKIQDFKGIIGHVNVRKDKTDPAPMPQLWDTLKNECNLTVEDLQAGSGDEEGREGMSKKEINELFSHNARELNKMYVPAGSMVKGLIMELERKGRDTYIKLRDAEPGGHIVFYDFMQGDPELVKKIGRALGFKQVTSNKLEVHNA